MTQEREDRLYAANMEKITDFVFDDRVVKVFADMVRRSVPGYATLLSMLPVIVRHFVTAGSRCYDLGCSQGACTLAMRHSLQHNDVRIIAVDNSSSMVASCREQIIRDHARAPVDVSCEDVCETSVSNASLVVMNFTLQFVEPSRRAALLRQIHAGLNPGGALLLSEKIRLPDSEADLMTALHEEFKRANGYSELEISQKRSALENVLVAESLDEHKQHLYDAGFSRVVVWFQCFNFVSLLAIK